MEDMSAYYHQPPPTHPYYPPPPYPPPSSAPPPPLYPPYGHHQPPPPPLYPLNHYPPPPHASVDEVRTLFIAGLPGDTKHREIYNLFREFHGYESCQLRASGQSSQAFAFAVFSDQQSALAAMHALNMMEGRIIQIRNQKGLPDSQKVMILSLVDLLKCFCVFAPTYVHASRGKDLRDSKRKYLHLHEGYGSEAVDGINSKQTSDVASSTGALNHLQGTLLYSSVGEGMRLEQGYDSICVLGFSLAMGRKCPQNSIPFLNWVFLTRNSGMQNQGWECASVKEHEFQQKQEWYSAQPNDVNVFYASLLDHVAVSVNYSYLFASCQLGAEEISVGLKTNSCVLFISFIGGQLQSSFSILPHNMERVFNEFHRIPWHRFSYDIDHVTPMYDPIPYLNELAFGKIYLAFQ
ncbi:hypothetical protein ACLOJK_035483 [Asimina triloba]